MTDPMTDYAAAIETVRNRHETYIMAGQVLADAEEELERTTLNAALNDVNCVAYIYAGKNETAQKERRKSWFLNNFTYELEEVRTAKHERNKAEMEWEHARKLCNLERLRCEWMIVGGISPDLLGSEPPVGREMTL